MAKRKYMYTPVSGPSKRRRVDTSGMRRRNLFRSTAGRAAEGAFSAALSRVSPYAGLAYKGAKMAYRGYKLYKAVRGKKARSKVQRYVTSGAWQGKFRKVSRAGARTKFDSYGKSGVIHSTETIGSQTDQDVVYIMNEVMNSRDVIKYMVAAVFRRLIEKAGMRVNGMDRCPFDRDAGDANEIEYNITVLRQNMNTGAVINQTKNILTTDTFNAIVDFFKNTFEQYCSGYGELNNQNLDEPLKVVLWTGPAAGANPIVILSEIYFNEVFLDIYGKCELKIQNRTKATGGSEDAENINNNPLEGYSYMFKGVPKPKGNSRFQGGAVSATILFERIGYVKGLSTFGGSSALSADFKEPPPPKQFWNCGKAAKVRLDPGAIKTFNASGQKTGNFLKLLKSIRLQLDAAGSFSTYSIFPVQMVALEDVINANAAETISVQYEVQRTLGVKCWTKEKKFFTPDYELRT